jgi:putative glycosyltransferase (TIGR04372 family)
MYHSAKVKKPAANYQLKKMWERVLHIYGFAALLGWVNNRVPGAHDHTIPMQRRPRGDRDIYGMTDGAPPHVSFTAEEERFGQAELVRLGIPKGAPFVCFNARDSAYLEQAFPDQDWSYHRFRNSSINDYLLAADELTRRGYYAIRMGYLVNETLETDNPMIMDYATKYRTDFLDIYLSAKCRFFLSTGTGIDCVPLLFRKPVAMVNFAALETVDAWSVNHVIITKKQWWRKEQRLLTFREIIDSKIGLVEDIYEYERHGIDLIESTPEEISAVAIEMDKRIAGTWQATPEDEELQRRFWSLFKPSEMNQVFRAHYGAEFLRQNQQLLV